MHTCVLDALSYSLIRRTSGIKIVYDNSFTHLLYVTDWLVMTTERLFFMKTYKEIWCGEP